MIEKVNPSHPDKIADRIAGAIVDLAYSKELSPKVSIEVLIGHNICHIIGESSCIFKNKEIKKIVWRIAGKRIKIDFKNYKQDKILAYNQIKVTCGDNGIFKGIPLTREELELSHIAHYLYNSFFSDGKYILDDETLIVCQSYIETEPEVINQIKELYNKVIINPLGPWTGGTNVDSGATNRKLGSDLGASLTGGGLHGKDLSKPDVSITIYAFLKAQTIGKPVYISCAIGDTFIDGKDYSEIISIARDYINQNGGFEKLAEWGLF